MNAERLLRLAAILEAVPPERFRYDSWATGLSDGRKLGECGTTGCALGWATTVPEWGLRYDVNSGAAPIPHVVCGSPALPSRGAMERSIHSARLVFDLTAEQAEFLFVPNECLCTSWDDDGGLVHDPDTCEGEHDLSAAEVAAKIRRFVADRGVLPEPEDAP